MKQEEGERQAADIDRGRTSPLVTQHKADSQKHFHVTVQDF